MIASWILALSDLESSEASGSAGCGYENGLVLPSITDETEEMTAPKFVWSTVIRETRNISDRTSLKS